MSAEHTLKTVKLASAKYLDQLPTSGSAGGRAFRDLEWEDKVLRITQVSVHFAVRRLIIFGVRAYVLVCAP